MNPGNKVKATIVAKILISRKKSVSILPYMDRSRGKAILSSSVFFPFKDVSYSGSFLIND